jgi:hypothetical protein
MGPGQAPHQDDSGDTRHFLAMSTDISSGTEQVQQDYAAVLVFTGLGCFFSHASGHDNLMEHVSLYQTTTIKSV